MNLNDDTAFEDFVNKVTGDETAAPTTETDKSEMPEQKEVADKASDKSEMPNTEQEADKGKQADTSNADEADDKADTDKTDSSSTDGNKPPEHVPYARFQKVRTASREVERNLLKANKELEELRAKNQAYQSKIALAESEGVELRELPNEIDDDLIKRVEEGDPDAMADALRVMRGQGKQQVPTTDVQPSESQDDSWVNQLTDNGVKDTLEDWHYESQESDLGKQRWNIALEIDESVRSNPDYQSFTADEIGNKVIELTNAKLLELAKSKVQEQASKEPEEDMPESLSGSGGNHSQGDNALLGLSGDDLIAAIDQM